VTAVTAMHHVDGTCLVSFSCSMSSKMLQLQWEENPSLALGGMPSSGAEQACEHQKPYEQPLGR